MPDVLLPFQTLSDPLPSQGNEFTPQFPPQSLDLPSITISRNLVEQDGVLHSNGLHMVSTPFITWDYTLPFVFRGSICEALFRDNRVRGHLDNAPMAPLTVGQTRLISGIG